MSQFVQKAGAELAIFGICKSWSKLFNSIFIHMKCICASFFYNLIFLCKQSKQQGVLSIRHRRLTLATSCSTCSHCSLAITPRVLPAEYSKQSTPRVPELWPQLSRSQVLFTYHKEVSATSAPPRPPPSTSSSSPPPEQRPRPRPGT